MLFPVAGVEVAAWVPPLVGFSIAFFCSMGGVSGAFLLLPFQMSVLGFTSPSVSPTNMIYNVAGTPSGVLRYIREGRMFWPLTGVIVLGELPGLIIGIFLRLAYMPDPRIFKFFVGLLLLYLGGCLVRAVLRRHGPSGPQPSVSARVPGWGHVSDRRWGWREVSCAFEGETYALSTLRVIGACFLVGIVSGVYGIGGACILVPLFVAVFGLPVYIVAGSTLMGNFVTSLVGILGYQVFAPVFSHLRVQPDWLLGLLFGVGGVGGMYLGARCQKYVPARWIKAMLAAATLFVAIRYLLVR